MDRNADKLPSTVQALYDGSLSARRAWIEIVRGCFFCVRLLVALRKESVDRNIQAMAHLMEHLKSLSARRAWIEMYNLSDIDDKFGVALRKESVDRNSALGGTTMSEVVALRKESVDRNYG